MLDVFIIEEIRRRERGQGRDERPAAELPLPPGDDQPPAADERETPDREKPEPDRGVVIIDFS